MQKIILTKLTQDPSMNLKKLLSILFVCYKLQSYSYLLFKKIIRFEVSKNLARHNLKIIIELNKYVGCSSWLLEYQNFCDSSLCLYNYTECSRVKLEIYI